MNRLILPTGPTPSPYLAIGEAPGQEEHRRGYSFCGKSGQLLDTYLLAAGLPRHHVRVTNLYPYWTGPGNPDPTEDQIDSASAILRKEIETCRPKFILGIGRLASRFLLHNPDLELEVYHGIPCDSQWGALVVPAVHPAAGFHDPSAAARSAWDIRQFVLCTRGSSLLRPATDVVPWPDYRRDTVVRIQDGTPAIDTESLPDRPWGLSISYAPGTATVVRAEDLSPMTIESALFHHALYDLGELEKMGIRVKRFQDTIVKAFALGGIEPLGLKALAARHLGMTMKDFQDLVRPYHTEHATIYLQSARPFAARVPPPEERLELVKGKWKIYQPQSLSRRLKNIERDLAKGKPVDLVDRWSKIEPDQRASLEKLAGPFPPFSFALVPTKKQTYYSGRDADATVRLNPVLDQLVKDMGVEKVVALDTLAIPMIARMQQVGMKLDIAYTHTLESTLERKLSISLGRLRRIAGPSFNPGSPAQVAQVLFKSLRLPTARLTKVLRSPSTDDKTLEMLLIKVRSRSDSASERFITTLQEYREAGKFLNTFVAPLPGYLSSDGRVHPDIRTTRVISGRPSTTNPNFLAFPKRSQFSKYIRNCFIAGKGRVLISLDFSQIELRVLADQSKDKVMMEAFRKGEDLHARTACLLFNILLEDVDDLQHRYPAKTLNFAIAYGIMAKALYEQLLLAGVVSTVTGKPYTLEECDAFIRRWFQVFSGVRGYLRSKHSEARRFGFVRTPYSGRLRYLPNIHCPSDGDNAFLRYEAERQAGNFPIQGGATDYAKSKLPKIERYLKKNGLWAKGKDSVYPLLWIHDEFLLEAPARLADDIAKGVQAIMEDDQGLMSVPIVADYSIGERWGEL